MVEQVASYITMALVLIFGLSLGIWSESKKRKYGNDERWQTVRNKANIITGHSNRALAVLLGVSAFIVALTNPQINFSFIMVMIFGMSIVWVRDAVELFALMYFDKRI